MSTGDDDGSALADTGEHAADEDTIVPLSWFVNTAWFKSVLAFVASSTCFFVFFALIAKRTVRQNGYNLYIIFLILPDAFQCLVSGGLFNTFIAVDGGVKRFPPGFYYVDVGIWFFYYYANCFLNAIVAYEINKLVVNSYRRRRTKPPTTARVYKQVGIVYVIALFLSLSNVLPVPWTMFTITDPAKGQGDMGGDIFGELAATCIAFGLIFLPMIYVLYIRAAIAKKNLLPSRGRTRVLSLFFMRIIIVFIFFYLPNTVLTAIVPGQKGYAKFWMQAFMGTLSSLQALVNLYMISLKGDIREALRDTLKIILSPCQSCRCPTLKKENDNNSKVEAPSGSGSLSGQGHSSGFGRKEEESKAEGIGDIEEQMKVVPTHTSTTETAECQSEWEEEDVYPSPEERAQQISRGSGKSLAGRLTSLFESANFKATSSHEAFRITSIQHETAEEAAGIFKSEEMRIGGPSASSEFFVRRLSAMRKPTSRAFSIDDCDEDGVFMPEEEKTASGHFVVRRFSAQRPIFHSSELMVKDDAFNSEEKHTFESTENVVDNPVDLHKIPSNSGEVLESSQSSAKMHATTSDTSLFGRMRANVSDGLLAKKFRQKHNSKNKLNKMGNAKGGAVSTQILRNAMSSFDPTVDVLCSPAYKGGKGLGKGAQNANWGSQAPASYSPESPFSKFLPENSSGHKNKINSSALRFRGSAQENPEVNRNVRFSTNSKSSSTMDDALRLYKKQSKPQSSHLQSSEQSLLGKNSQSMVTFGRRNIDSLLPPLTSGSDSSRSLHHNASFKIDRNTPSNTLPLQKNDNQQSLLHQTCRLYPTMAPVVESALRVTPDAIRQLITPTLENGNSNQNTYGYPLNIALSHGGSLEVIKILAKAAPEILLEEDGADGSRSFDIAIMFKYDWPVLSMLLRTNVECSQVADRRGNYPLHNAANHGLSLDIIRTLYRLFPKALQMRNSNGDTPLDIAQRSCSEDVKTFLKDQAFSGLETAAGELRTLDLEDKSASSLSPSCTRVDMDGRITEILNLRVEGSG